MPNGAHRGARDDVAATDEAGSLRLGLTRHTLALHLRLVHGWTVDIRSTPFEWGPPSGREPPDWLWTLWSAVELAERGRDREAMSALASLDAESDPQVRINDISGDRADGIAALCLGELAEALLDEPRAAHQYFFAAHWGRSMAVRDAAQEAGDDIARRAIRRGRWSPPQPMDRVDEELLFIAERRLALYGIAEPLMSGMVIREEEALSRNGVRDRVAASTPVLSETGLPIGVLTADLLEDARTVVRETLVSLLGLYGSFLEEDPSGDGALELIRDLMELVSLDRFLGEPGEPVDSHPLGEHESEWLRRVAAGMAGALSSGDGWIPHGGPPTAQRAAFYRAQFERCERLRRALGDPEGHWGFV